MAGEASCDVGVWQESDGNEALRCGSCAVVAVEEVCGTVICTSRNALF